MIKSTPRKRPKVHSRDTKEAKERLKEKQRINKKQHPLKQSPTNLEKQQ